MKNFPDDTLVVLATSPAGLGHIRVMESLRAGLPDSIRAEAMGIDDGFIKIIHRLSSKNILLRNFMEFIQNNGLAETQFTHWYRQELRKRTEKAHIRLSDLVRRRKPRPKTVVVLATHFGLGHQLAMCKRELEDGLDIRLVLAVVVTDDSPQKIWGVDGADLLFVPSNTTREALIHSISMTGGLAPEVMVVPYPIHPDFDKRLPGIDCAQRLAQLAPSEKEPLKILLPLSGAAVQQRYFVELLGVLDEEGKSKVTVVGRENRQTGAFLRWCQETASVGVVAEPNDREVVLAYHRELMAIPYAVEITKPSEQAFKALVAPNRRGGVVLLFSEPVGRQEDDNLKFLRRHGLLPTAVEQQELELLMMGWRSQAPMDLLKQAHSWRGLLLPRNGYDAGEAIGRLRRSGVLAAMGRFSGYMRGHEELDGDGVKKIWETLAVRV